MNKLVVGIGEILWNVQPCCKKIGGAPASFAFLLSELGMNSRIVSAVGNDCEGDAIADELKKLGVDYDLYRLPGPTGQTQVELDENGASVYHPAEEAAWDHLAFDSRLNEIAEQAAAVYFGTLAQRNPAGRHALRRFLDALPPDAVRIFDINLREPFYTEATVRESLHLCDILKMNLSELAAVRDFLGWPEEEAETSCRRLQQRYGLTHVVLTMGKAGSLVLNEGDRSLIRPIPIEMADTTGVCEAFMAGFTAGLLNGKTMHEAHQLASDLAEFVCTHTGSMQPVPLDIRRRI